MEVVEVRKCGTVCIAFGNRESGVAIRMCHNKSSRSRWAKRLLVVLIFLLLPVVSAQAEDRVLNWKIIDEYTQKEIGFYPDGYVTIGNDLYGWYSLYGTVYHLNLDDGIATYINEAHPPIREGEEDDSYWGRYTISVWHDQLVALDWQEQCVLSITEERVTEIAKLPLPSQNWSRAQVIFRGDLLYLCVGSSLYCQDMTSDARARQVASNVCMIAPWTEERVLGIGYDEDANTEICALDAQGGREKLGEVTGVSYTLTASPERETFWVEQGNVLYSFSGGVMTRLRTVPSDIGRNDALLVGDQYLKIAQTDWLLDLTEMNQTPLVIKGFLSDMRNTGFTMAHPEIGMNWVMDVSLTPEDVYTELLLGGGEADLYFLPYSSGVQRMMEKGYVAVLPESEALMVDAERMWPQYASCVTADGQLQAMIAYVRCGTWSVSSDAKDEAESSILRTDSYPATLAEALALQSGWNTHEANIGQPCLSTDSFFGYQEWTALDWLDAGLMQVMLSRNRDERLDLQGHAAFRQMMEQVKTAYEEAGLPMLPEKSITVGRSPGAILGMAREGDLGISLGGHFSVDGINLVETSSTAIIQFKQYQEMPQLFEGEPMRYPAVLMVYLLNPRSEHVAEAMTYLEWVAENRPLSEAALLFPDAQPHMRDSNAKSLAEYREDLKERQARLAALQAERVKDQDTLDRIEILEGSIASMEKIIQKTEESIRSYDVSEELLTFYQEKMLPNIVVVADALVERGSLTSLNVYDKLLEICERYLAGNLSAQQALQNMQQVIDTWWMENQ